VCDRACPAGGAPPGRVLNVRSLRATPPFDGRRLACRVAPGRFARARTCRFRAEPAAILTDMVIDRLGSAGVFAAVADATGSAVEGLALEGTVTALYGDATPGEALSAVLEVRFTLIDHRPRQSRVLLVKPYRRRVPLAGETSADLADALARACEEIVTELIVDLRAQALPATEGTRNRDV